MTPKLDAIHAANEASRADEARRFIDQMVRQMGLEREDAELAWRTAWTSGRNFGHLQAIAWTLEDGVGAAFLLHQTQDEAELAVERLSEPAEHSKE